MRNFDEWISVRDHIRQSSNVDIWETEIERLLLGQRSHLLEEDESASDYIEALLESSTDPASGRKHFREALFRIIATWQPSSNSGLVIEFILDLISAYTPPSGQTKLFDYLAHYGEFRADRGKSSSDRSSRLTLQAIRALQGYYPRQLDESESPSFDSYKRLLKDALKDKRYSGYSLTRLVNLGIFSVSSEYVRRHVVADPDVLKSLVSYSLGTRNDFEAIELLRGTFFHSLSSDTDGNNLYGVFLKGLHDNGARLVLGNKLDPVVLHLDRTFRLSLEGIEPAALDAFKRIFIDPLMDDPERRGLAIAKLLRLELVALEAMSVRDAVSAGTTEVIEHLISFALEAAEEKTQAARVTLILDHCLALDSQSGVPTVSALFTDLLIDRGVKLDFSSDEESGVFVLIRDHRLPISYAPEGRVIVFGLLQREAEFAVLELVS